MAYPPPAIPFPRNYPGAVTESRLRPNYDNLAFAIDASSSSPVALPDNNYSYDVFINHRGPDVKKTFASLLYRRLRLHGFKVFLDQHELQKGDHLTSQIEEAIQTASVHVAIFSVGYADSKWCLEELVQMLQSGATIIPIFYDVKPAQLRWTRGENGVYAKALRKLENKKVYDSRTDEKKPRFNPTTIESWKAALSRVADISGFELEECNGDQGELLDKVVQHVSKKVKRTVLKVAKYPTGLDETVKDFENGVLLQQEQHRGKPQVVGIVGVSGIGKTTLAKELFNRKSPDYRKSCFLYEVREYGAKNSLPSLQRNLLMGLTLVDQDIESVAEGREILKRYLSSCHAFFILDDVDDVDQLDAILPVIDVLHFDSLVLITSQYKDVLLRSGVPEASIYHLTGLNIQHSRQLFCWHAFHQPNPFPGFKHLVEKFVICCNGLSLYLKVFGALLYGNNRKLYWEDQLDKLQQTLDPIERLRICYDALRGEEQYIFLDIACFFIREDKDTAIRKWDGSGWKALAGFQNLESKCLVDVDNENKIQMDDSLRDMGKNMAVPHRFWYPTGMDLLEEAFERSELWGIRTAPCAADSDVVDYENFASQMSYNTRYGRIGMKKLQLLDTEDGHLELILRRVRCPNLIWLRCYKYPYSSLPSWIPMQNLRVLNVAGSELETLWLRESQAPLQLRELEITAPLSKFPESIGQLKHLEVISVRSLRRQGFADLEKLPEEFCHLRSLKTLVLVACSKLKFLPDSLGNLTNLEHIDLSYSSNLQMLPNSFGNLIRLKYLDLQYCSDLTISVETLGDISSLEHLDLSHCEKIEVLPSQVTEQRYLKKLYLRAAALKELPSTIGNLRDLQFLVLESPFLEMLPRSLGDLRNLKELSLFNCNELKWLPKSVALLSQLTKLTVVGCRLRELPFRKVEGERETLTEFRGRRERDSSIEEDSELYFSCSEDFGVVNTEIWSEEEEEESFLHGVCPNLQHLFVGFCSDLVEVGTLPNTLLKLQLLGCSSLRKIEGLCDLSKLQILYISQCREVEELPSVETLVSLEELRASECVKLKNIRGLAQLSKLRLLDVSWCDEIEELEGAEHLKSLTKLDASGCTKLRLGGGGVLEQFCHRLNEEGMLII
jgi:Leucine-rich repeat (LRR) protein